MCLVQIKEPPSSNQNNSEIEGIEVSKEMACDGEESIAP